MGLAVHLAAAAVAHGEAAERVDVAELAPVRAPEGAPTDGLYLLPQLVRPERHVRPADALLFLALESLVGALVPRQRGRDSLAASEDASGGENAFLPIRTRFFDDLLRTEAEQLDQVVLLGAGLDTRAFRLTLPTRLRWFEIDTPELLGEKEPILAALGAVARCQRTLVAADLTADWSTALLAAGFEVGRRTGWLAEGLLFYLSGKAVQDLLTETRRLSGVGSLMGADVFGSGLLTLPSLQPNLATRAERGLPPPFTTDDPLATFRDAGWP
ncbi:MAG: SAM-dependent methyltransferase, partial [Candidatus Limnocylindrales bacterium]